MISFLGDDLETLEVTCFLGESLGELKLYAVCCSSFGDSGESCSTVNLKPVFSLFLFECPNHDTLFVIEDISDVSTVVSG